MLCAMSRVQRVCLGLMLQLPLGCMYGASTSIYTDYKPPLLFFYNGTDYNIHVGLKMNATTATHARVGDPSVGDKFWQVVPAGVHMPLGALKKAEAIVVAWQWYGAWLGSKRVSELQFCFPQDGGPLHAVRLQYEAGKYSATLHATAPKAHSLEDIFPRVWRCCLARHQRYKEETLDVLKVGVALYKEKAKDPACARHFLNLPEAKTTEDKQRMLATLDTIVRGKECAIKSSWLPSMSSGDMGYAMNLNLCACEILALAHETCKKVLST